MYDLGDASKWEFMFSTTDKPLLLIPTLDEADPLEIDDDEVLSLPAGLYPGPSLSIQEILSTQYCDCCKNSSQTLQLPLPPVCFICFVHFSAVFFIT